MSIAMSTEDLADLIRIETPVITANQNLNKAKIACRPGPAYPIRADRGPTVSSVGSVEVVFEDLESRLADLIRQHQAVVGCMAWLTGEKVLRTLASRKVVSVIINKEDFLRPDQGTWSQQQTKRLYSAIPSFHPMWDIGPAYNWNSGITAAGIRCAGVRIDGQNSRMTPRMHHKFFVFCDHDPESNDPGGWVPKAVWTGSYNATFNASRSLENAVIITDPVIARAYFEEWGAVLGISEPLEWTSPYVTPDYRLGA